MSEQVTPAATGAGGRQRVPLSILLTPIVILAVLGTVTDVIGPGMINERPLLQMFLNPRNRYLLLASPQVGAVAFFVVGFVRLVLTDPLFYLLGVQYGDAALRWGERKLGDDVGFIRTAERLFARFGSLIILIAPSGYLCLLAGATGMKPRRFIALNVTGTVGRLLLIRLLGDAFEEELLSILGFIQRYQWWLVGLSLAVVALQSRRKASKGTLRPPSELEREIEAAEHELEAEHEAATPPPSTVAPTAAPSVPAPAAPAAAAPAAAALAPEAPAAGATGDTSTDRGALVTTYRQQLEEVAASKGHLGEAERLHSLFDVVWRHAMEERPDAATFLGWPEGNDRLPDLSLEAVERRRDEAPEPLKVLATIDPCALDAEDRLSHDVFAWQQRSVADAARFPGDLMTVTQLEGPQTELALLLGAMPFATAQHHDDLLARLRAVPTLVDQTIELLEQGRALGVTPPRITLRHVPAQVEAHLVADPATSPLLGPLQSLPVTLAPGRADQLRRDAATIVGGEITPAFARLQDYLAGTYLPGARETTALADLPDGGDWYRERVRHYTTTGLTPEEIHAMGVDEVQRIGSEMDRVRRSSDYTGPAEGFAAYLRSDPRFFFATADDVLASYRDIAKRIDPGVVRLFNRLPRLPFGVSPVPAEMAPSAPAAFYLEGSLEMARPGRFFANTHDLGSRPNWNMESVCLHEAVPGHHFQISLAQELRDLPEFRRRGLFTAYVEGWGLYCESLGPELGMYQDPYQRFGALDAEMLRAIRLVVDTGMHALGWSRDRAIAYFGEHSVSPQHEIVVEVDRYLVLPGQALAYKVGERKLAELRAWATQRVGDAFDIRAFHDEVLAHGALPLDVLETLVRAWAEHQGQETPAVG